MILPLRSVKDPGSDPESGEAAYYEEFQIELEPHRSVLDGILAARQLPGVTFADAVGIIGYSQGGHAAAWVRRQR